MIECIFEELKVGDEVVDLESNTGVVDSISDIHNVFVLYGEQGNLGSGLHCLDKSCSHYDPLFKLKPQLT